MQCSIIAIVTVLLTLTKSLTSSSETCSPEAHTADCKTDKMAVVVYDEGLVPPHYKTSKDFVFGDHKISIKQDWARDGVAGVVWDAAVVLCEYLSNMHRGLADMKILELGAGTGLSGICAAHQGAKVTVTDKQSSLQTLNDNVQLNNAEALSLTVKALHWGDLENPLLKGKWDLVIGSDIIYIKETFDDLLNTMKHLNFSQMLLSCRLRYEKDENFIDRAKHCFNLSEVLYDTTRDIHIYQLMRINTSGD